MGKNMRFNGYALGLAIAAVTIISGCEKSAAEMAEEMPTEQVTNQIEPTVSTTPVGAEACVAENIVATVDRIIASNTKLGGAMLIRDGDVQAFSDQGRFGLRDSLTTLVNVDAETSRTTCASQYVVESEGAEKLVPITYSAQPNAAGNDLVVEVQGINSIQEAINAARSAFYYRVIYPRDMQRWREEETAASEARGRANAAMRERESVLAEQGKDKLEQAHPQAPELPSVSY